MDTQKTSSEPKNLCAPDNTSVCSHHNESPKITTNRSIRMTDCTHTALTEVKNSCKDASLDQTLNRLINTFHMTEARKVLPERDADIAQFESLCRKLIDSYVHSLILFTDADARAKEAVSAELKSKDKIIINLQEQVLEKEYTIQELQTQLADTIRERDAAINELDTLKMNNRVDTEIRKQLEMLQLQLAEALSSIKN